MAEGVARHSWRRTRTHNRSHVILDALTAHLHHDELSSGQVMDAATSSFNLGTVLLGSIVLFPLACLFFGTRGGYYNTDKYDGNGTAH